MNVTIPKISEIETIKGTCFYLINGDTFDYYDSFIREEIDCNTANVFHELKDAFERKMFFKQKESEQNIENNSDLLFSIKPVDTWLKDASSRPTPKQLFSCFWYEGEICILFADTNLGKSILAVQLCNSISTGVPIVGFTMESENQPVLFVDFELSDKQFQLRYCNEFGKLNEFSNMFLRAELNPDCTLPEGKSFEKFIIESIEKAIFEHGFKVLIVDNLTYLRSDNEKGRDALSLMKELKELKSKYGLTILCLAHVPKRDSSKPISKNDLAGSKMLINFCDSAFAIGESALDSSLQFLKQIKSRNSAIIYNSDYVPVFKIDKQDNFLQFEFVEFSTEQKHLRTVTNNDLATKKAEAKLMKSEGMSNIQIAKHFGISEAGVRKWKL